MEKKYKFLYFVKAKMSLTIRKAILLWITEKEKNYYVSQGSSKEKELVGQVVN